MKNKKKKTRIEEIQDEFMIAVSKVCFFYSFSFLLFLKINIFTMILFGIISAFVFFIIFLLKIATIEELIKEEERIV